MVKNISFDSWNLLNKVGTFFSTRTPFMSIMDILRLRVLSVFTDELESFFKSVLLLFVLPSACWSVTDLIFRVCTITVLTPFSKKPKSALLKVKHFTLSKATTLADLFPDTSIRAISPECKVQNTKYKT